MALRTLHHRREGIKLVVSEVTRILHIVTQPLQGTVPYP